LREECEEHQKRKATLETELRGKTTEKQRLEEELKGVRRRLLEESARDDLAESIVLVERKRAETAEAEVVSLKLQERLKTTQLQDVENELDRVKQEITGLRKELEQASKAKAVEQIRVMGIISGAR